jgi:hypothetical protein
MRTLPSPHAHRLNRLDGDVEEGREPLAVGMRTVAQDPAACSTGSQGESMHQGISRDAHIRLLQLQLQDQVAHCGEARIRSVTECQCVTELSHVRF